MKKLIPLFVLFFVFGVNAATKPGVTEIIETAGRNIVVSNDGTGLVKNVKCLVCTSKILIITNKTKAFENGKAVDLVSSRSRYSKKAVMLRFDAATREVTVIRW